HCDQEEVNRAEQRIIAPTMRLSVQISASMFVRRNNRARAGSWNRCPTSWHSQKMPIPEQRLASLDIQRRRTDRLTPLMERKKATIMTSKDSGTSISRRRFLRVAAAGISGLGIGSLLAACGGAAAPAAGDASAPTAASAAAPVQGNTAVTEI